MNKLSEELRDLRTLVKMETYNRLYLFFTNSNLSEEQQLEMIRILKNVYLEGVYENN